MNELINLDFNMELSEIQAPNWIVEQGKFDLPGFDEMLDKIDRLGLYIRTLEVTPDNLKESKKLAAQVRKISDTLNRERIDFKNQYLRPYDELAEKFKILTNRVEVHENLVRNQIRKLEDQERQEKKEIIQQIFEKRLRAYGAESLYPFDTFMQSKYLNKTVSINKVENEMVQWFEQRKMELEMLKDFAESVDAEYTDILNFYLEVNDLASSCKHFQDLMEKKKALEEDLDNQPKRRGKTQKYRMIQFRIEDQNKIEQLLNENNIEFKLI